MAPKTKPAASTPASGKPASGAKPSAPQDGSASPAQAAQVKPANDPTPANANTVGKVVPKTSFWQRALDKAEQLMERGEIGVLNDLQQDLQNKIDAAVEGSGYSTVGMVLGAGATALNQVLLPTNVVDFVPGGKGASAARKAGKATSGARDAGKAADARKAADAPTEAKPANGSGGGYSKKPPRFKDCGKFGKHKDNQKLSKRGELNSDHIPSGAALKKAYEKMLDEAGLLKDLRKSGKLDKVLERMYNEAPTISTPEDVHKAGRTYAGKNKKSQSDADSGDLSGAVQKDTDAIKESMREKDPGCVDAYEEAAEQLKKFDFKDFFENQLKNDPDITKITKG